MESAPTPNLDGFCVKNPLHHEQESTDLEGAQPEDSSVAEDQPAGSHALGVESQAEFFSHLPIGMARVSEFRFEMVNDAFCRMLGYTRAELLGVDTRSASTAQAGEAGLQFLGRMLRRARQEGGKGKEERHLRKDGSFFYGRLLSTPVLDESRREKYCLLQLTDVEESFRTRQVQELHSSVLDKLTAGSSMESILSEIIQHAEEADPRIRAAILLLDPSCRRFEQVMAPSMPDAFRESAIGMQVSSGRPGCAAAANNNERVVVGNIRVHPDWQSYQELAAAIETQSLVCQPFADSSGRALGVFTVLGRRAHQASAIDLSIVSSLAQLVGLAVERHRTLESLRFSRARFQTMIDHAPEAVLLLDCGRGRFVEANDRVRDMFEVSPTDFICSEPWLYAPEFQPDGSKSRELMERHIEAIRQGQSPIFNFTVRSVSGKTKPCEIRLVRLPSKHGLFVRASVIDVSQHRQAERALRRSEENLRATLDSIGDTLIATDAAGRITHFNPVAESVTGMSKEAALTLPVEQVVQLLSPEDRKPFQTPLSELMGGEQPRPRGGFALLVSKDGSERFVSERAAPIRGRMGKIDGMVLILRDVTRWHEGQERALQSRKLEAIGHLAGGVAHDFNNLLTGIMGNAELLGEHADPAVREAANLIALAAHRSADVTGQLLRFSRNETTSFDSIDVHVSIQEACKLMGHDLKRSIHVELALEAENPMVFGDATGLLNMFMNLVLNSRDAIESLGPDGPEGLITIQTKNKSDGQGSLVICVQDNGIGIAPEIQAHIFEPFFTTKQVGAGTGLGLAGIYGTVESMQGTIRVKSEPGCGASFCIELPSHSAAPKPSTVDPRTASLQSSGRILVVDDEKLVRSFVMRALQSFGYEVVGAEDGMQAEELYRAGDFDLVLLDMIMPRRGGLDTYRALAALDEKVNVIVISGFTTDSSVDAIIKAGAKDYLPKPFLVHELGARVKAAIEAQRSSGAQRS